MEAVLETLLRAHVAVIKSKKQAEETLKVLKDEQENITHAKEVIMNIHAVLRRELSAHGHIVSVRPASISAISRKKAEKKYMFVSFVLQQCSDAAGKRTNASALECIRKNANPQE